MVDRGWVIYRVLVLLKWSIFASCSVFYITCKCTRADGYLPKELQSTENPCQDRVLLIGTTAHGRRVPEPSMIIPDSSPPPHFLGWIEDPGVQE